MFSGSTGGSSSTCEMIILRNEGHSKILGVCMGIFTTALRNKKNKVKFSPTPFDSLAQLLK